MRTPRDMAAIVVGEDDGTSEGLDRGAAHLAAWRDECVAEATEQYQTAWVRENERACALSDERDQLARRLDVQQRMAVMYYDRLSEAEAERDRLKEEIEQERRGWQINYDYLVREATRFRDEASRLREENEALRNAARINTLGHARETCPCGVCALLRAKGTT